MTSDYSMDAFNRHMVEQDKGFRLISVFRYVKDDKPSGYEITGPGGDTVYDMIDDVPEASREKLRPT